MAQVFSCEFCEIFQNTFFLLNLLLFLWWLLLIGETCCYKDLGLCQTYMLEASLKSTICCKNDKFITSICKKSTFSRVLAIISFISNLQKQPFADVLQNRIKNFAIFTVKHLSWSLFLTKVSVMIMLDT